MEGKCALFHECAERGREEENLIYNKKEPKSLVSAERQRPSVHVVASLLMYS